MFRTTKPIRRFTIYPEAHPAWVVPAIEVVGNTFGNGDGLKLSSITNAEELLKGRSRPALQCSRVRAVATRTFGHTST